MLTMGEEEGVFESNENKVIQNLIRLNNVKVKEVMTPRVVTAVAPEEMGFAGFPRSEVVPLLFPHSGLWKTTRSIPPDMCLRRTVLGNPTGGRVRM